MKVCSDFSCSVMHILSFIIPSSWSCKFSAIKFGENSNGCKKDNQGSYADLGLQVATLIKLNILLWR